MGLPCCVVPHKEATGINQIELSLSSNAATYSSPAHTTPTLGQSAKKSWAAGRACKAIITSPNGQQLVCPMAARDGQSRHTATVEALHALSPLAERQPDKWQWYRPGHYHCPVTGWFTGQGVEGGHRRSSIASYLGCVQ